jgi:hypothetical protein
MFIYGIFFAAWYWALSNYRAHWHNFVLNENKSVALTELRQLRKSIETTSDIKDKLALFEAMLLLTPDPSAYLEGDKEITGIERFIRLEELFREIWTHAPKAKRSPD